MTGTQRHAGAVQITDAGRFDVFVSYDRRDFAIVDAIVDSLHEHGVTVWRDTDQIGFGDRWIRAIEDAMQAARSCAVFLRLQPTNWMAQEYELALKRAGDDDDFRVIPVLLPESLDPSELPDLLTIRRWVDLRDDPTSQEHIEKLVDGILGGLASAPEVKARNPYVGLRAFGLAQRDLFFGRDEEAGEALRRLESAGMLTIVGPSGTGKSSLLHAKLLPTLTSVDSPIGPSDVVTIRPGLRPTTELAAALMRRTGIGSETEPSVDLRNEEPVIETVTGVVDSIEQLERLSRRMLEDPSTLVLGLRAKRDAGPAIRDVWVIDQLEQLFADRADTGERTAFLDNVVAAVEDGELTVITGLRSDAYRHLDVHPRFAQLVSSNLQRLDPMTEKQLRDVIVEPARAMGLGLQAGLVELVLRDLRAAVAPLPLLQHAMFTLYKASDKRRLTVRIYTAIGGVNGALAQHAERIYETLLPSDRVVVRNLFSTRLAAPLGEGRYTGVLVSVSALESRHAPVDAVTRVIDQLTDGRILSKQTRSDGAVAVEVVHDALFEGWPRLEGWLEESAEERRALARVTSGAQDWAGHKHAPSYLISGKRLDEALDVDSEKLNRVERRFLETSRRLDEARRFAAARSRAMRGGLGTMVGFALMLVFFAIVSGLKVAFVVTSVVISAPMYILVGGAVGLGAWFGRRDKRIRLAGAMLAGALVSAVVTWGTIGTTFRAGNFRFADLVLGAVLGGVIGLMTSLPVKPYVWAPALVAAIMLTSAINPGGVWNTVSIEMRDRAIGGAILGFGAAAGFLMTPRDGVP